MSSRTKLAIGVIVILLVIGAALLVYSQQLKAQDAPVLTAAPTKLTWTPPASRSDGYPFDMATEGSEYRLNWTRGANGGTISVVKTATSYPLTGFKAGTAFTIAACDDTVPPLCSNPSNEVKISGGPPLPPSGFSTSE